MQKFAPLSAGLVLALAAGLCAQSTTAKPAAPASDPVVISAGPEHIRASQFQALIDSAPPQNRAEMSANKRAVADELGKMLALVAAARQRGLDQQPAFKAQMMLARDNALAKAMVDALETEAKPTTAQEQAYYAAHTTEFQQTKVRHILITDTETPGGSSKLTPPQALAKAQKIYAELKAGGDFAALAKANSDDPGSKDKGGELGEISPGETVPSFEAAIEKLPVGTISDPVHTRFGYHIIEVEGRSTQPFAQAQPQIEQKLGAQNVENAINSIAAQAHVTISDSYFGPAKPAPGKPGIPNR